MKQFIAALLALFLYATSFAQTTGTGTTSDVPKYASDLLASRKPAVPPGTLAAPVDQPSRPVPPEQVKWYRPTGCDTLITHPTESFICTCDCVTFNPRWITNPDPLTIGLNTDNLTAAFAFDVPQDIFQSGRLIGLDSDGPLLFALFSKPIDGGISTTRYSWRYNCKEESFTLLNTSVKSYK